MHVTEKGQITIPTRIRDAAGVLPGANQVVDTGAAVLSSRRFPAPLKG